MSRQQRRINENRKNRKPDPKLTKLTSFYSTNGFATPMRGKSPTCRTTIFKLLAVYDRLPKGRRP